MKNNPLLHISLHVKRIAFISFVLCCAFYTTGHAQVLASMDSTTVKIGEELKYKIQVETDSTDVVIFPEGQTFAPLEVIESYKTDTTINGSKFRLTKEYGLTQFDSGHYTIPKQKIMIGDKTLFTPAMKVEINDVLVDTTKQKMYAIKPMVEVEKPFIFN